MLTSRKLTGATALLATALLLGTQSLQAQDWDDGSRAAALEQRLRTTCTQEYATAMSAATAAIEQDYVKKSYARYAAMTDSAARVTRYRYLPENAAGFATPTSLFIACLLTSRMEGTKPLRPEDDDPMFAGAFSRPGFGRSVPVQQSMRAACSVEYSDAVEAEKARFTPGRPTNPGAIPDGLALIIATLSDSAARQRQVKPPANTYTPAIWKLNDCFLMARLGGK